MDDERDSAAAPVSCGDDMMSCVWETRREQDDCARSEVSATSSRRSAASCRSMDQMADLAALEARRRFAAEEAEIERKRVASEAEMERIRLASEAEVERIRAALEQQRLASEAELNQLRLDRDIAVSRARLQVYAKYENDEQEMVSSDRQTEPQKRRIHEHLQVAGADPTVHSVRQLPNMTLESHRGDDTKPLASIQQQQRHDMEKMMSEQKRHDLVSSLGQYDRLGMGRRDRDNPDRDECRFVEMPIQRQSGFEIVNSITGIDKVVESLNETMKRSQLPRLDLPVFNGDELDFQQWLVSFERIIEENTSDPARRLHYLVQYTAGNANTLVSGYLLDPTNGYQAAKRELKKEYGDPYVLSRAYLRKIEMWRPIQSNDIDALKTFGIFLKKCRGSMPSLRHLQQLNTDHYLQTIVMKLPQTLQSSWRKSVHVIEENCKDVMFEDLVKFIDQQWQIAKHPVFSADALQEAENKVKSGKQQFNLNRSDRKTLLATNLAPTRTPETVIKHASDQDEQTSSCQLCHNSHDLDDCKAYISRSLDDRKQFLIQNRMCFACYGPMSSQHNARLCERRRVCRICGNSHPTGLHGFRIESPRQQNHGNQSSYLNSVNPDNHRDVNSHATTCVTDARVNLMTMSIVMVRLSNDKDPSREITVYAALDSMSTASFVSEDVWKHLGSPGEPTEISVRTMTDERRKSTNVVRNLSVISINDNKRIKLPKVYTQEMLSFDVNDVPSHEDVRRWPHLCCLISEIPDLDRSVPIGLLIGVDCPGALQPCDVIFSVNDGPFAVKTALGWCISGPKQQNDEEINGAEMISCCCANVSDQRVHTTETSSGDVKLRMYEHDSSEQTSEMILCAKLSPVDLTGARSSNQNNRKFLKIINDESRITNESGQLLLPCRHPDVQIPDDRMQVQVFEAESPPSGAKYALQGAAANDDTGIFGAASAEKLRTNSHVDDLLSSADNVEQTTTVARGALRMLHSIEFEPSSRQVIDALSMKTKATTVKNDDLLQAPCPIEQAFGACSYIVNNIIDFIIDLKDEHFTVKDILATIGSICDPLSLAATFVKTFKRILQDSFSMQMEWDDAISDDTRTLWERWRNGVMKSKMISIARCLKPSCFDRISSSDVHTLTGEDLNVHKQIAAVCVTGEMQDLDKQISKSIFTTSASCYQLDINGVWIWIVINRLGWRSKELPNRDVSLSFTVDE